MVYPAQSVRRSKLWPLGALMGLLILFAQTAAAKSDAGTQVRRADAAIATAASQDVALLAPTTLSQAVREYGAAESALKNKQYAEANAAAERSTKLAEKATSIAAKTRDLLKDTVALRSAVIGSVKAPHNARHSRIGVYALILAFAPPVRKFWH